MHLWATSKLADKIAAGEVSARDKVLYFVFLVVFATALDYAAAYYPAKRSFFYLYEAVVVTVVSLAGAYRVVAAYRRPIDGAFFEISYLLTVPLYVKTTMVSWVAIYGGYWLIGIVFPHIAESSIASPEALAYWLGRLYQIFPFLVAVAIAVVFWYRLAHHVAYVASKRGA